MPISRMQQERQNYGLGSFVKKVTGKVTKPFTKVAKKIVPKELAGIMRLAAPFLGPVAGPAAYLLGTAKQTGRISPIDLALIAAPRIGKMRLPDEGRFARFIPEGLKGETIKGAIGKTPLPFTDKNLSELLVGKESGTRKIFGRQDKYGDSILRTPTELEEYYDSLPQIEKNKLDLVLEKYDNLDIPMGDIPSEDLKSIRELMNKPAIPTTIYEPETSGIFGKGGEMFKIGKGDVGIFETKAGQALFGKETTTGYKPSLLKIGATGLSAYDYLKNASTPQEAGQMLVEQTGNPDDYERGYNLFSQIPEGAFDIPQQYRLANGGMPRSNFAMGGEPLPEDPTKPVNPFQPKPTGPVLPNKMADIPKDLSLEDAIKTFRMLFERDPKDMEELLEFYKNRSLSEADSEEGIMMAKNGGFMRKNFALGTRPTAQESGLGGLPIEADMRYTGGFMPYGAVEKADDVPARLSKNEFVFTADAVRAAGGGSVEKGAQKMYNTMKQLEAQSKGMA
jgi:hypothetical protein